MKRFNLTLAMLLAWSACPKLIAQCNCSQSWNGSENNIPYISSGTFCIASGNFTGSLNGMAAGATLCVSNGASFNPSSLNGSYAGSMQLYGTSVLPGFSVGNSFYLKAYSKVTFAGNLNFNGTNATLAVAASATAFFNNGLSLNGSGTTLNNNGYVRMSNDFSTQTGTVVNNKGDLRLDGNFNPSGVVTNDGVISATRQINLNANGTITNNCRFFTVEGMVNGNAAFVNNGIVWVTGANKDFQNNGTLIMGPLSSVRGSNFTNNGTVNGSGVCYFTGTTTQQGTFTGTSASARLYFYDATQSNASNLFDNQNAPATNTYRSEPAIIPDTIAMGACQDPNFTSLRPPTLLPIVLKSFAVMSSTSPYTLLWEVENTADIEHFEVEQSVNGTDFTTIARESAASQNSYSYKLLSSASFSSYYRLKLVGKDGKIIYSQIIKVGNGKKTDISIKNITGTSQIWMLSQLDRSSKVDIVFYNEIGQMLYSKYVNVIAGTQQVLLNVPNQIKGIVLVSVKTDGVSKTSKLLLQ